MQIFGNIVFWISYRLSFLVAKWRLGWSYWNRDGKHIQSAIRWEE